MKIEIQFAGENIEVPVALLRAVVALKDAVDESPPSWNGGVPSQAVLSKGNAGGALVLSVHATVEAPK